MANEKAVAYPGGFSLEYSKVKDLEIERMETNIESALKERHYGPGPHPGTGTPQTVHAPNGAGRTVYSYKGMSDDDRRDLYTRLDEEVQERQLDGEFGWLKWDEENETLTLWTDKDAALEYAENEIRDLPYEKSYIFSDAGLVLELTQEDPHNVHFNKHDLFYLLDANRKAMHSGMVMMHNHPGDEGQFIYPPSFGDFDFSLKYDIKHWWVVTPDGKYVMKAIPDRFSGSDPYALRDRWNEWGLEHYPDFYDTRKYNSLMGLATSGDEGAKIYRKVREAQIEATVEPNYYDMEWVPND